MPVSFREAFIGRYGVYRVPPGVRAYRWSPEVFVKLVREFVLKCKALPQIRTRVPGGRRIEYNGSLAIYLVPWGGTDDCQTVVLYDVPEDLWAYMDQSRGEWRNLYQMFVEQLYGGLTEDDRRVLEGRPWQY